MNLRKVAEVFIQYAKRGFSNGLGARHRQMCVEAAVAYANDEEHNDKPNCVHPTIRDIAITINDGLKVKPKMRADILRRYGIAQLGTAGLADTTIKRKISDPLKVYIRNELLDDIQASESLRTYISELPDRFYPEGHVEAIVYNVAGKRKTLALALIAEKAVQLMIAAKTPGSKYLDELAPNHPICQLHANMFEEKETA